jgi:ABC-type Mn2+/Zn2+ transport system permease subunit
VILSSVMIFTPILITGSVHITNKFIIDEDVMEVILLSILFALNFLTFKLYKQEASKQDELISTIKNDKKKAD